MVRNQMPTRTANARSALLHSGLVLLVPSGVLVEVRPFVRRHGAAAERLRGQRRRDGRGLLGRVVFREKKRRRRRGSRTRREVRRRRRRISRRLCHCSRRLRPRVRRGVWVRLSRIIGLVGDRGGRGGRDRESTAVGAYGSSALVAQSTAGAAGDGTATGLSSPASVEAGVVSATAGSRAAISASRLAISAPRSD